MANEKTKKALVIVQPIIIPGIGRIERSFGYFALPKDPKAFAYSDAVIDCVKSGRIEMVDVPEGTKIRTLKAGMSIDHIEPVETVEVPALIEIK